MSYWLVIPISLALYAALIIFIGHFLHAGGATRDVRDD